ncbi:hypothetical protein GUJ93_ZPchr0009g1626 [Zizania palustris]|uniref:Uncharacterized protein n=1 Tax=Zizania palustris TaxID=103762 RepID=A0A8J5R8M3_ZIZPA|nr:hypothetical protein GUJ93_ZPchr0009g1626 [Zizania palustris]
MTRLILAVLLLLAAATSASASTLAVTAGRPSAASRRTTPWCTALGATLLPPAPLRRSSGSPRFPAAEVCSPTGYRAAAGLSSAGQPPRRTSSGGSTMARVRSRNSSSVAATSQRTTRGRGLYDCGEVGTDSLRRSGEDSAPLSPATTSPARWRPTPPSSAAGAPVVAPCRPAEHEAEAVELVAYTALHCVRLEGKDRPAMADIVANLETAVALCEGSAGAASATARPAPASPSPPWNW